MNKLVFDIETGGFEKTKNALCELGAIVVNQDNEIVETFQHYIRPYYRECGAELHSYKPDAMVVNGITELQIAEGDDITDVLCSFVNMIIKHEISAFIGHNSDFFDVKWVSYLIHRFTGFGPDFDGIRKVDTMKLAMARLDCKPPSYKLGVLCEYYGIELIDAHTAIGDCRATLELYKRLL